MAEKVRFWEGCGASSAGARRLQRSVYLCRGIGLGSRVWGLGFRVQGLGSRVYGLGFRVIYGDNGTEHGNYCTNYSGFRVQSLGFDE